MARLSPSLRLGLALFVFFALDLSRAEDKCRSGCQGVTPNTFKYLDGTTYKYNLESTVDVSLSTIDGQQSSTKLKATVLLTQQPQCVQVLRLQNVQITGADGKKHGTIPNLDKPIKINFHDGHVEDIICAESGDNQNSLNVKRAVASLFQAALNHHHETDVFGVCPTETSSHKEGNILTITKNRVLNKCSHRENIKHDFMATSFNLHSEIKSSPLLKGDYVAEMRVKDGILDHALITENYMYMPFSIGKNGVKSMVQTKLQFAGKSKDAPKAKCSEPKSIIFENPHPTVSPKSDVSAISTAIKETAGSIGDTVSEHTAKSFAALVKIMAAAKKDDLLAVYNQVNSGAGFANKEVAKKVFLDALFRTGNGDSVEVAIELLKNKQLSPLEQRLLYLGMSFVRHVTPNSLTSAASLLDVPNLPREAYLGIGTLAAHYCKEHDCKNVDQLNKLTQKLLAKLKDGKATNRAQEDEMIAVLKAIANMKHLNDAAVAKLISIASDKKGSMRLRVAALDAYMADPCKDKLRDSAIGILKDIQLDAEIRIKAYWMLTKCPTGKVATVIKNVLDNEPSYQVGGFIMHHIRNLRASANPDNELAKRELGNINTSKRFPIDPRKYSFNTETSYSFDTLGMSSAFENNVIYSQNSFLPRSVCINMTTEVFGHKFNFLEIDARQENLDKLLEHYFGPLGVVRNKNPEDLLASGKETGDKIVQHLRDRITKTRSKRHVPKGEFDAIAKQTQIKTNELNNDLDYDLSIKLFGSEMLFLSINENAQKYTPDVIIDKIFDRIDQGMEKLKNFDYSLDSNMVFLDAELSYPTSMGFPLRLAVEGVSSVQLKSSGSIDMKSILSGDKDHIMKLTLIPSANIDVSGRLTLDASIIENGLKTVSSLYTATGSAVTLEVFNSGKGIDAKFTLPVQKQELFSAKHEIVLTSREVGAHEVDTPLKFVQASDFYVCLDQLSEVIGLSACVQLNQPNVQLNQGVHLPFPLNGNSKASIYITRDQPVTYHIRNVLYDADKAGVEFVVETLGKDGDKKVSFQVEAFRKPEMYVKATLDSAIKKATIEGRIVDKNDEKSISATFSHDNMVYAGKLGIVIAGNSAKATYTPLIEYQTPHDKGVQKSPYTVEGSITAEHASGNAKYTFNDLKLVAPGRTPIAITGNMGRQDGGYFTDVTVSDGTNQGSVRGQFKATANELRMDAEVLNSISPISNFKVKYDFTRTEDHKTLTSDLTLTHGPDFNDKQKTLKMYNTITSKYTSREDHQLATKNTFSYPLAGIEGKMSFNKVPKAVDAELLGKYNNVKMAGKLNAAYNQKTKGDYDVKAEVEGLENKVKMVAKRSIVGDKSTIENSIDVNGKKFEASGTIMHKVKPNDVDVGAHLTFKCPKMEEPLTVDHALKYSQHDVKTHLKVSTPSVAYIDFDLTAGKQAGGNGHMKINIKEFIVADGELKADKWNGKAFMLVEFVRLSRKMKVDSNFHLSGPKYDFAATFYPNFEKTDSKITVLSNNKIEKHAIDSHNELDVFGHKFETTFKGAGEGDFYNGKHNGEFEAILSCGMYFGGKFNREVHFDEHGVGNGNIFINMEQRANKNTPGRKFTYKGTAKNVNSKERTFDLEWNFAADNSNGKNFNADIHAIRTKEDAKRHVKVYAKLYGSVMPETIEMHHTSDYHDKQMSFTLKTTAGDKYGFNADGKFDARGGEHPHTGSFDVAVKTSNPKVKTIEISGIGSMHKTSDKFDLSGKGKLFVDDDGTNPDATVDLFGETDVKLSKDNGHVKGTMKVQKMDPITVAVGYGRKEENGVKTMLGDASVQYANGKNIKADIVAVKPKKGEYELTLKVDTPYEKAQHIEVEHKFKRSDDSKKMHSDLVVAIDGKKYHLVHNVFVSDVNPLFEVDLTHPDGTVDKLHVKASKNGHHHFASEVHAAYARKDFTFDGSFDANIPSMEEFSVVLKLDSPKLKMDKLVFEAKNKKDKGGKLIEVQATSAGNNLIKGSTTYKTREESGKYVAEGSGEFTVKNEKKTGNFKFSRQMLEADKNGEQGVDIRFDAGLGNKAVDAEFKVTNKHFRIVNSYCEEKKDCAHFEIDSKTNVIDVAEYNHELEISIDLRRLGLAHEFGLQAVTKRKEFQLDHTVDVHFQSQENNKYQYSLYVHPHEAGVSLTTPKRQVALEGHLEGASKSPYQLKADVVLYLNKKADPSKKIAWTYKADGTGDEKAGTFSAESRFTSPGLSKDLVATAYCKYDDAADTFDGNFVLDVFSNPKSKIVGVLKETFEKNDKLIKMHTHYSLKSEGLDLDMVADEIYEYDKVNHAFKYDDKLQWKLDKPTTTQYLLEISPKKFHNVLTYLNTELYKIDSTFDLTKESQVIDTKADALGLKPITWHYELKNFNTMKYTLHQDENPSHQLVINAAFIPGQIADFRAAVGSAELLRASIKLDEANFLKPDYGMNVDNIQKEVVDETQKEFNNALKEQTNFSQEKLKELIAYNNKMKESIKANLPKLQPIKEYYVSEMQKLKDEITADKTIQEVSEYLKNVFGAAAKAINEVLQKFIEVAEKLREMCKANCAKMSELYEKDVLPMIKKYAELITKTMHNVVKTMSDMFFTIVGKITTFIDAHQAELKQIATTLSSLSQDVGRFFYKNYERLYALIAQNIQKIIEEIKALPLYEELKQRYELVMKDIGSAAEPITNVIKDALNTLKEVIPNEEAKNIIGDIIDYIEKKINREKVDDLAVLEKIMKDIIAAIKRAFESVGTKSGVTYVDPSVFGVDYFYALPRFVAARFSPLNMLLSRDDVMDNLKQTMYGWSFNPRSFMGPPFRMYALLVQGQHVFTFDGKHITFPGTCNYLLAHDAVNGNFSVAGTYANGLLTSITVTDKTGSITVKKSGHVMLNKDAQEFPVRTATLEAYRLYHSVSIVTKAGLRVHCDPQLVTCVFSVSGFYHAQLRGLLGNANNEPYDDFTIPNGKIVTSESDFGNAYKMTAACKPVKVVDHHTHNHQPTCTALFSNDSPMKYCYPFVNPEHFRMACDHGVAAGVKDTEQSVAMGYVVACNAKFIPIHTPQEYLKCKNGEKPVDFGTKFSVKLPGKAADVVLIVEQVKANEPVYKELVQTFVNELTKELGSKGISDVEFHLMGYGGEYQKYPSHFTNGGKLSWKGKLPAMKFTAPPEEKTIDVGCGKLNEFLELVKAVKDDVTLAVGMELQARTFHEASKYPFRAHATKTLIAFTGSPCKVGKFLPLQKLRALLYTDKTMHINLVTPFNEFKVKDAKTTKSVVGFNNENVYTFADAAKKTSGSAELHKELEYSDYCVDFTLKVGGSVFVTDNFVNAKGAARKQFGQVVAHNVAAQVTNTEQGLDCECSFIPFAGAVNKCKVVYSNNKESKSK